MVALGGVGWLLPQSRAACCTNQKTKKRGRDLPLHPQGYTSIPEPATLSCLSQTLLIIPSPYAWVPGAKHSPCEPLGSCAPKSPFCLQGAENSHRNRKQKAATAPGVMSGRVYVCLHVCVCHEWTVPMEARERVWSPKMGVQTCVSSRVGQELNSGPLQAL